MVLGFKPKYKVHGGSEAENLALQNIQVCGLPKTRRLEADFLFIDRRDCEWFSLTCLPSFSLGRGANTVDCLFLVAPTSMNPSEAITPNTSEGKRKKARCPHC